MGKHKKGGGKIKNSSKSSSLDQDLSNSKEASPALSWPASEGEASTSSQAEAPGKKYAKEQRSFFSGNPFNEKVQGILHFYKEKYFVSWLVR